MPDAVVIGLGPAGIVAARILARAGRSVVAIQAEMGVSARSRLISPRPTVRSHAGDVAQLGAWPAGADGVGGSKRLAAPQAYRLDAWAVRALSLNRSADGPEMPPDVDLMDWPIEPYELDEYYERVEDLTRVGPRPGTGWTDRMAAAAVGLGWRPFAAPAAAETDMSPLLEPLPIQRIPGVATEILRSSSGAASGVRYVDADGASRTLECDAVVLAGSVIPSIRLLLLSGIDGQGTVGRWFMSHNTFVVHGFFPGLDLGRDAAGPATATAVSVFEGDRNLAAGRDVIGGSILQAAMTGPWDSARAEGMAAGLQLGVRADPRTWVRERHASIGAVWAQPDQLPRSSNMVDLDPEHRDPIGRPVPRITYQLHADDHQRWSLLSERMAEWLRAAGAAHTWGAPLTPQPVGTHLYGGVRMGTDPLTSSVDSYGRFHTVPGLVVVGSSTFPTTGGRGPVETVEALAWRAAEQLASDLG
ncbi:GMC oxidoreductase [Microbacterium sp.]|uniref:GMC oxidoreductase n=1 Tax=Microbacterium sp. TaxID=51671 RepID=UPI0037C5954A